MNSSLQFIGAKHDDVAIVPNASPVGIKKGTILEINHREYLVTREPVPIVSRKSNDYTNCNIVYQIHVTEMKI